MGDRTGQASAALADDDAAFAEGAITLWANLLTLIGTLRETDTPQQEVLDMLTMLHETNEETIWSPHARAVASRHLMSVYRALGKPDRSGVRPKAPPLVVAPAAEMVLDALVEESPGRRRLAERLEGSDRHVVVEILAGLPERDGQDTGVVIEADAVDRRGLVEPVRAHIDWSACLRHSFQPPRQPESGRCPSEALAAMRAGDTGSS